MSTTLQWAPLHVPVPRRLQTAAITLWLLALPSFFLLNIALVYWFPYLAVLYWLFVLFDKSHEMGGRKIMWFRQFYWWKLMRDYFPVSLVKESELDPSKAYVFGYHPHGIIGLGAWVNFITEGNEFSSLFPGINLRVCTLETNFRLPLYREFLLSLGLISVSKKSCMNTLARGPGNAILIVVGGASEALYAKPRTNDLVIKRRLGFIKLALTTGSSLVPIMSFGENDIYDQMSNPPGSRLYKFQQIFQKIMSFSPPVIHGRGIFTYNYGVLPFRRSIVSVVGTPIECPKILDPSLEEILTYQKKYLAELVNLYDTHKDRYAIDRKRSLAFIE